LKEPVTGPEAGKWGFSLGECACVKPLISDVGIMNQAIDPNGTSDSQSTLENPARLTCFEPSLTSAWIASASGIVAALLLPQTLSAGSPSPSTVTAPSASPWSVATSAGIKTGYDDNVLLQDFGDQANRESWFNTLGARISATYQSSPSFKALISYAPDFTIYEGEPRENHTTHRGMLNLSGGGGDLTWEMLNSVTRIDGDNLGPTYTLNGGTLPAEIPVIGAMAVRDRRDAAIYRNSFKLAKTCGRMFVRPVASFYHHNFMTEQHRRDGSEPGFLGYENYVDRREISGGMDMGYEAWNQTWLVAGVRVGHQKQYQLLGQSSPFSNDYHRILAGIEGSPVEWLKLNVLAGPDFRDYDNTTPAGFDADQNYVFFDATASITPTKVDTITLGAKRFMQTAFVGISLYEDIVYEATWCRQLAQRFALTSGFKAYHADWRPPVIRDEWMFTPSLSLGYTHSPELSAELAYSYDWTYSQIPNTTAREFTRHLVSVGLKYAF
jgi:hypothetical protein